MSKDRRDALARPYRDAHDRSVRSKARPPRDLLRWFLESFREEMPETIHVGGVWRDARRRGDAEGYEPVGGSAIGTPRASEPFRQFIEDDAYVVEHAELDGQRDQHGSFRYPMRAALARLAGRGHPTEPYPFMARVLYRTALRDGDWDSACESLGIIEPVRRFYIMQALERLWMRFEEEPMPAPYRPPAEALQEAAVA